ncbi:MAG TPA: family 1 glycosylhydrolase [Pseudonocardiaceae bacterium]
MMLGDDFERSARYRPWLGPVHVDYSMRTRTPKDSYRWYQSQPRRRA